MRQGRTKSDLGDKSQAWHRAAARSAPRASSPDGSGALLCNSTSTNFVSRPIDAVLNGYKSSTMIPSNSCIVIPVTSIMSLSTNIM